MQRIQRFILLLIGIRRWFFFRSLSFPPFTNISFGLLLHFFFPLHIHILIMHILTLKILIIHFLFLFLDLHQRSLLITLKIFINLLQFTFSLTPLLRSFDDHLPSPLFVLYEGFIQRFLRFVPFAHYYFEYYYTLERN